MSEIESVSDEELTRIAKGMEEKKQKLCRRNRIWFLKQER